jgi:hypothetical protein
MKLTRIVLSVVPCVCLAAAAQASVTTLDWQFENAGTLGSPLAPTPGGTLPGNSSPWTVASTTSNPSGGAPAATFSGASQHYYFGSIPGGDNGNAQGIYDVGGPSTTPARLTLTLGSTSSSPLDYTLTVLQYNTQGAFPSDGRLTFSISGAVASGANPAVVQTTLNGQWEQDTWTWSGLSVSGPQTLSITPTSPGFDLFFDEVQWTINGNLTAVPEPVYAQSLGVVGLLAICIGSWLRRKGAERRQAA